jgi:hypothetical protein
MTLRLKTTNAGTSVTYIVGMINEIRVEFMGLILQNRPIETGNMTILCNIGYVGRRRLLSNTINTISLNSMES